MEAHYALHTRPYDPSRQGYPAIPALIEAETETEYRDKTFARVKVRA